MRTESSRDRPSDIADSTVFIAGGASGVGFEVARHFVRAGTQRIGLIDGDAERGREAAAHIYSLASGIWALSAAGNVTDPADAARVTSELSNSLGPADILVDATPTALPHRLLQDTPATDIPALLAAQTVGPINVCRAVLPDMLAQHNGVVVIVGGDNASGPPAPGRTLSSAAAAALVAFTEALAVEVGPKGIKAEVVVPSSAADAEPAEIAGMVLSACRRDDETP